MKKILIFVSLVFIFFSTRSVFASDKVEINTATLQQLDEIIGVGPAIAQKIIDARPFSSIDDLIRVNGIGEKTLQKIKDQGLAYVEGQVQQPDQETNPTPTPAPSPIPIPTPSPTPAPTITYSTGVVFNEILASPIGPDETEEWIEIYNQNNYKIDLSGWKVEDKEGKITTHTFPSATKINKNGYLILTRPTTKISLNNSGDGLNLIQPNGKIIDSINYEKATLNQSYNKTESGWVWSTVLTPGSQNIISPIKAKNPAELLSPGDKPDGNGKVNENLAALNQSFFQPSQNPLIIFLIALIITIFSAVIVFLFKRRFNKIKKE